MAFLSTHLTSLSDFIPQFQHSTSTELPSHTCSTVQMADDTFFSTTPLMELSEEDVPQNITNNVPEIVVIAPDGDAVLVVGPERARIRVSTRSLATASKVFRAMVSANWAEGQNLSSTAPKDIELPEDCPTAMEAICCVLHFQNDTVPTLTSEQTLKMAIVADKYDVVPALSFASTAWLNPPRLHKMMLWKASDRGEKTMINDGYLLAAAYIKQDVQSFARISHNLICHYTGSYADLYRNETIQDAPHPMTLYCLEERRNQLRTEIQRIWENGINEACASHRGQYLQARLESGSDHCKADATMCDWGRRRMERYKLLRKRYQDRLRIHYTSSIHQLVWESQQPMLDDVKDREITICHPCAEDQKYLHSPGETPDDFSSCTTYTMADHEISHPLVRHDRTFRAQWENLKRSHCICFDCLGGKAQHECTFGHLRSGPDPFTPSEKVLFDFERDFECDFSEEEKGFIW